MKKHTPLIVGNWKMNPATLAKAKKLFIDIRNKVQHRPQYTKPVVAPPFPFISEIERLAPSRRIELAAQDVFFESIGAHTGEVSIPMLKSVGVSMVIVGHSERRARGESDEEIYRDVQAVLNAKTTVIICVGEKERDAHGNYFSVVEAQLRAALRDVAAKDLKRVVIAYEPVWAIGTGKTASAEDAHEMKLFIQKLLTDRFSRRAADTVRVLYGGSVNKRNAAELLHVGGVDGFLIGGASLRASEFVHIINTAEEYAKSHPA
ncbi:triose-phosphate isomerase [bacterium]|nr:triose-phosphate isomerase [bacterium]|tara:strand:+ start:3481 stop:4266 length:786 start_codon:yes stop_codon:yes gene_type:complete